MKTEKSYYQKNKESSNSYKREYRQKLCITTEFYEQIAIPTRLKIDNYKCQECGNMRDLHVHHKHYNSETLTIHDLITLCRPCHIKEHKRTGLKTGLSYKECDE